MRVWNNPPHSHIFKTTPATNPHQGLRFTNQIEKQLLWQAHTLLEKENPLLPAGNTKLKPMSLPQPSSLPVLNWKMRMILELLGFHVSTLSWFDPLQTSFRGEPPGIETCIGPKSTDSTEVWSRLSTAEPKYNEVMMHFGTFLDSEATFSTQCIFPQGLKT